MLRLRAPRTEATRPCGEYPSSPSVQTQSVSVCAMAYSIELRPAARTKRVSAPRVPRDAPPARIYLFYYLSRETHLRSERDSERVDQHMHNQHYNTTTTEVRTRPVTSWPVHSVHDCTSDVHTPSVAWDLRRPLVGSLLTNTRQHSGVQYYRGLAGSLGARLPGAAAHAASLFITIGAKARWSLASLREWYWIVAYRHPVGVAVRHVDDPHLTVADEGDHRLRHHRVGEGRRHWRW